MKYYGPVSTNVDLEVLESLANKDGKHAVGVGRKTLYKFNPELKRAVAITIDEARDILEVTDEEINKIVESKGEWKIPEPVAEPVIEEAPVPEVAEVVEEVNPEQLEEVVEVVAEEAKTLTDAKIDLVVSLLNDILVELKDLNSKIL